MEKPDNASAANWEISEEPAAKPDAGEKLPQELFVNRELSWLQFNRRVLLEAMDPSVPLLERLKFLAIYDSNLDEFFMVRVGSLHDQNLVEPKRRDEMSGLTAAGQIEAIFHELEETRPLLRSCYAALRGQLKAAGVDIVDVRKISRVEDLLAHKCFKEEIEPLLSPQVVDRHHPFPFLRGKEQYVAISFSTKSKDIKLGIIPLGNLPPYFIFSVNSRQKVLFTADIVYRYAQELYSKYQVEEKHLLRVTRNADISPNEALFDYDMDFRGIMEEMLKKRKRLSVVRLQLSHMPSAHLCRFLCQKLAVAPERLVINDFSLDLTFGFRLADELFPGKSEMRYPEKKPFSPRSFPGRTEMKYLSEHDMLLCYPFHSMKTFIDLLYGAAEDPTVLSIKISLYRLANHSRVVSALVYAAEKGKQILCVVELRARFDEQNNISYAKLLEDAGCTVIYGLSDYKVHAKLCLITRRQRGKLCYITQIGTGNYNEKTAELYTDLCYITADEAVGRDAGDIFNALCVGETVSSMRSLWAAPNCYLNRVLEGIQQEIDYQRSGGEGLIVIKVNSLNDMQVMEKLIEASQAGVRVELFVRGICCLRPGIRGYTDRIVIRSVVGRYLEHMRIFLFGSGKRRHIHIGSGDLLGRNTRRRVEVFAEVRSEELQTEILKILHIIRHDNIKSWTMQPDGSYIKPERGDKKPADSQMELYRYFASRAEKPQEGSPLRGRLAGKIRGMLQKRS
ncbi:MAG: polyphosphate kinase 1 [Provencibacterium sp.]|jgi:polyphosphate kinase|nr:polyphosphate kinase 1 [Provencibacterium sp.]